VVKDTSILAVVLFLGIYLPLHYYGGYGAMFAAIQTAKPNFLALPAQGESLAWFDSTVLLTALGFYMWPHTFGSLYTAKEERAFHRNAAMLPLYQLILLFVFFAGFAAILQVPGLMAVLFPFLPEALRDLNIGVVALMLNVVTLAIVSAVTRRRPIGAFSS
jgi:solute:Na+ symporter, SSS family